MKARYNGCVAVNTYQIIEGEVVDCLKQIGDGTVQCCVTSPPYWGLRDYGTAEYVGGAFPIQWLKIEMNPGGELMDPQPVGYGPTLTASGTWVWVESGDMGYGPDHKPPTRGGVTAKPVHEDGEWRWSYAGWPWSFGN